MRLVASVLTFAGYLYLLALIARMLLDVVASVNRSWRPTGFGLVAAEFVYTVTDPPLKLFRRFIPPLRVGPVAFDLGFTITFFLCLILISIVSAFAR